MNKALAGGGPFIDWGVYDLSFHLGLLDDQPELLSMRRFSRNDLRDMSKWVAFSDVEQHGAAWLEFSGGLSGWACGLARRRGSPIFLWVGRGWSARRAVFGV